MGFDDIDKRFRPKPKLELECECCQKSTGGVKTRFGGGLSETGTPMCDECYAQWEQWSLG